MASDQKWTSPCSSAPSALACDCQIVFKKRLKKCEKKPATTISRYNLNMVGDTASSRSWTPEGKTYDCQLIIKSPRSIKCSLPPMWPILQDRDFSNYFINKNCIPCPDMNNFINIEDLKKRCLRINNRLVSEEVWYVNSAGLKCCRKKKCKCPAEGIFPCKVEKINIRDDINSNVCGRLLQQIPKPNVCDQVKHHKPGKHAKRKIKHEVDDNPNDHHPIIQKSNIPKEAGKKAKKNKENLKAEKEPPIPHKDEPNNPVVIKSPKKQKDENQNKRYSRESSISKKDSKRKSAFSTDFSVSYIRNQVPKDPVKIERNCFSYRHSTDCDKTKISNVCREGQVKIITFETEPSFMDMYCFKKRKQPERYYYPDGSPAICLETDGSGRVFYSGGHLAIALVVTKLGHRLTVMSDPCFNEVGEYECSVPVAVFDSKGNGVVYDIKGKKRLNYDQAEGILYDTRTGAPARWQWKLYKWVVKRRKELQILKETATDFTSDKDMAKESDLTKGSFNSMRPSFETGSTDNPAVHAIIPGDSSVFFFSPSKHQTNTSISNDHHVSKIRRKSPAADGRENDNNKFNHTNQRESHQNQLRDSHYPDFSVLHLPTTDPPEDAVPVEPRPIAMKITNAVSLHILHQEHIHIDFRCFPIHLHLNIGVRIKMDAVTSVDKMSLCTPGLKPVPCFVDLFFKRTQSLKNIHEEIKLLQDLTLEDRKIRNARKAKMMGLNEKYIPSRESMDTYIEYVK